MNSWLTINFISAVFFPLKKIDIKIRKAEIINIVLPFFLYINSYLYFNPLDKNSEIHISSML